MTMPGAANPGFGGGIKVSRVGCRDELGAEPFHYRLPLPSD